MIGHKIYIVISFIYWLGIPLVFGQNTVGTIINTPEAMEGYTLFTVQNETYLINNCGEVVHQWVSNYHSGKSVYLLENGNLLRAAEIPNPGKITIPGIGGRVELFDWDNNLIWECNYSTETASQNHEVYPMPNGNVLMLAATVLKKEEAIQMGRNPGNFAPNNNHFYNVQILELQPRGSGNADVVWEWNAKDHLIQDFDKSKDNYGNIAENPQLLDINFLGISSRGANWLHINSMQYNLALDQIIMSSRHLHEIYIIDHSTSIAEAAGSTGGRYGKGGDILYRWGNPMVYKQGTADDQQLFGPHYPHWIADGLKDAGKILIFNNGSNRKPEYSEIDIIVPPVTTPGNYVYQTNTAYGPVKPDYIYTAPVKTEFFSIFVSSAQRLPNGNMLICEGSHGRFFEIDSCERIVWEYVNPVGAKEILSQGDVPEGLGNIVFRAKKYTTDYTAFANRDLTPGLPIEKEPNHRQTDICY
ncbi:MAG: hypothetical protein DHS20C17_24440 [Cyclobacteriaceae bacterium]|nr:MAG: hypothetical protein DHS20C17_24440 [Cyclobacteriaceae bacterium]